MGLERGGRVGRHPARPQRLDGVVDGHDVAAPQDQQGEQAALEVAVGGDVARDRRR